MQMEFLSQQSILICFRLVCAQITPNQSWSLSSIKLLAIILAGTKSGWPRYLIYVTGEMEESLDYASVSSKYNQPGSAVS